MKRIIFAMMLVGLAFSVADPSAVYCEQMGYVYDIVQTEEGDAGQCRMPNGQYVDSWAFYRGEVGTEYSYCVREGLGIKSVTEDMGTWTAEYAVCVYSNGTEVKLEDLLNLEDTVGETPLEVYGEDGVPETTELPEQGCVSDADCTSNEVCLESVCVEIPAEGPGPVIPEDEPVGLPNPASVYCTEQGGTLEIKKDAQDNEYGECTLADGKICEEWAYYRGECPAAVEPIPEPAPEPAQSAGFPWIPLIIVVVAIVLAYWFFIRK